MTCIWVQRKDGYLSYAARREGGNRVAIGIEDAKMISSMIAEHEHINTALNCGERVPFTVHHAHELIIQA